MFLFDDGNGQRLPRALGWFSLFLGVFQLAGPDALSRLIGVRPTPANRTLLRAVGARELVAAFGLLGRPGKPSPFLWARAAGDAMDLALLGNALAAESDTSRAGAATAAVAGVAVLDVVAATRRR
ncbi:MAG TPA: hypothetical protein VE760_03370 [Acidimicrobiales bacterium]|nr:hypothetical protein [Acidimicrobiales bacterium]